MSPNLLVKGHPMGNNDGNDEMVNIVDAVESRCHVAVESFIDINEETGKADYRSDVKYKFTGLAAMKRKNNYDTFADSTEYIAKCGEHFGAEVTKYSNEDMHSFSPNLTENISFSKKINASDMLLLKPIVYLPLSINGFSEEKRDIPVDFDSRMSANYSVMIHIPEGYSVESLPQNASYRTDNNEVTFKFVVAQSGDCIVMKVNLAINKNFFVPEEYDSLKGILDTINNTLKCDIIIKKNK